MDRSRLQLDAERCWETELGAWIPGERVVFRGKDLFEDLQHLGWTGLLLFGVTGRLFDSNQISFLEGLTTLCASFPDPRIWNNRVAALAGTAGSTAALGVAAATAVSEAEVYGGRVTIWAADFLALLDAELERGVKLEQVIENELERRGGIPGFGRPVVRKDERIDPVMALAERHGLARGKHVNRVFEIEQVLTKKQTLLAMNVGALWAAFTADLGLSPEESHRMATQVFLPGLLPCYVHASSKPEGAFFPLRCEGIRYEGRPRRALSEGYKTRGERI